MQFRFREQDHCRNVSYLIVAAGHITYAGASGTPYAICNFAKDEMALKFRLRDLYEGTLTNAQKAQAMLEAIRASCGSHRVWTIDESTQAALRAAPPGPKADSEQLLNLIDRLVLAIGTHAPHLMTGDVDVMAAHALLVKHGRWAPPPPPAKAPRARRARKTSATA